MALEVQAAIRRVLTWRWTPFFAISGGSVLFVVVAVAAIPRQLPQRASRPTPRAGEPVRVLTDDDEEPAAAPTATTVLNASRPLAAPPPVPTPFTAPPPAPPPIVLPAPPEPAPPVIVPPPSPAPPVAEARAQEDDEEDEEEPPPAASVPSLQHLRPLGLRSLPTAPLQPAPGPEAPIDPSQLR